MTSGVPWQVTGVRRQAREAAREAARWCGMSVGEWLDGIILDSARQEGVESRKPDRPAYDPDGDADRDADGDADRDEDLRLRCCLDGTVDMVRGRLAEIALMLHDAMPRTAIEALANEVRKLANGIDHSRHTGGDGAALAERLLGLVRAVQQVARKIDLIGSYTQDPAAHKQLEHAIAAMHSIVSHVASNDALAKLSEDVRALAGKIDQAASRAGASILSALEGRIATLADAIDTRNWSGAAASEFEAVGKRLIDRIERLQLTRGDHAALGSVQDRIAELIEKLGASDARLNHLEAIERGLAELLIHVEHQRVPSFARTPASPPPEVDALWRDLADLRQTERKTQDSLEFVHGTLGHLVDRLAMIETHMRGKPAPPPNAALPPQPGSLAPPAPTLPKPPVASMEAATPTTVATPPSTSEPAPPAAAECCPIDAHPACDHAVEPDSDAARTRNWTSAADRIGPCDAALGRAKPPVGSDYGGRSNFIAAARRAAQSAGRNVPASASCEIASAAGKPTSRAGKLGALIGVTAVVLIVLGSLQIARIMLGSSSEAEVSAPRQPAATTAHAPPAAVPPTAVAARTGGSEPAFPVSSAAPPAGRQSATFPAVDTATSATPVPGPVIPSLLPEPQAAAHVQTPPGGRDGAAGVAGVAASAPAPAPAKRKPPVIGPGLDLAMPRPAQ